MKIANLKEKIITLVAVGACVFVLWLFQVPCFIRALTHVPCPGCGMTRAYTCLLQGDIVGAFRLHRMFWSIPILGVYYFTDGRLFPWKWADYTLLGGIGLGFLVNWIMNLL